MLRRAGQIAIALALTGCTEQVVLHDVNDAGFNDADAVTRDPWQSADASCVGGKPITYNPQSAQVLILFDRSASMYSNFGSTTTTRAEVAQNALAEAVTKYTSRIDFGFEDFPSDPMRPCPQGNCCQGSCCANGVSIGPQPYNGTRVSNNIQCGDARGPGCQATGTDSPSNAALAKARDYYSTLNPPTTDDVYVLLVTSSDPSCGSESHDTTCTSALTTASDLGTLKVRIIVLSVDYQPKHSACLSQIPLNAYLKLPPSVQSVYPTTSPSDLGTYLTEIFDAIARNACNLSSSPQIPPNTDLTVYIGQDTVSRMVDANDQDGWRCTANCTGITLVGSACEKWVKAPPMSNLEVTYACSWCGGPTPCSSWGGP
jgi:hypothetical protein